MDKVDEILAFDPRLKNAPQTPCEAVGHAFEMTWTGIWCPDCEVQISELMPLQDLLSEERLEWLKKQIEEYGDNRVKEYSKRVNQALYSGIDKRSKARKPSIPGILKKKNNKNKA